MSFAESPKVARRDGGAGFDEADPGNRRDSGTRAMFGYDPFEGGLLRTGEIRTLTAAGFDVRVQRGMRNG